jgi:EpsI family protein
MPVPNYFRSAPAIVMSLILIGQLVAFHTIPNSEFVPQQPPLSQFMRNLGNWQMLQDIALEKEVQDLLKADDTLSRTYKSPDGGSSLSLFVAFFKTQRAGVSPHSPKVCLPGSGWVPEESTTVSLNVPGSSEPIEINRYMVSRGENKSVVLYWYQTHHRVVASEYMAKFYLIADSLRFSRSDTWLVRVVAPVMNGDIAKADEESRTFVRAFYQPLKQYMPK